MVWNNCILHIILAVASYLFWFVAALSGAVYFILGSAQPLPNGDIAPNSGVTIEYWKSSRYRLTLIYLVLGLLFFTGAIVVGFLKANIYWRNYRLWETKIIFTFVVWTYYFVIFPIIPILKLKKHQNKEQLISAFAVTGTAFIVLNIIISSFSKLHHYL